MAPSEVNNLSAVIGKCGRFQLILALIMKTTCLSIVWGMMFMAFGILNPGWTCSDKEIVNMSSYFNTTSIVNLTSSEDSYATGWSVECELRKECNNLIHNLDSQTVVSQWDLTCDLAWVPSFMISIQMVGVIVGSYVGGQIGEKSGRRASLYGNLALHGICHIAAIFSTSWEMHAALLFCVGFGIGGILTIEYPYCLEFMSHDWRGIITALPIWNFGATTFSVIIWIAKDWRYVHGITGAASCITFLAVFWSPESVRWLTVSGKVDEAKRTIIRIAHINGRPCPATDIVDSIALEEKEKRGTKRYTYVDIFRIRSIRGYTIKFGLIWIIMAITYYAISFGIKSLSGSFYLNFMIFSLLELPAMATVAPAVNRIGRRSAALIYYSIATLCALSVGIVALLASGDSKGMAILGLTLVCKCCITAAWSVVAVFSSELYPTVVRSLHFGFLSGISRIGVIIAPYLVPNDPDSIYLSYIIIGVLLFLNCVLTYSVPETKGKALPDIVVDDSKKIPMHQ